MQDIALIEIMNNNPFDTLTQFTTPSGQIKEIYSLNKLKDYGYDIDRLPVSIKIVLESVLRNCDEVLSSVDDVARLASWNAKNPAKEEIPFVVSRIILQDFTGVPLLVDLAAMRDKANELVGKPQLIEPLVPVDLIIDHSVQVDKAGKDDAFESNLSLEFQRNKERYEFLKWGQNAFDTFSVVPPSVGIIHQVNLEYLSRLVFEKDDILYPDTLVGTDSHTTMINGMGIVGWGVGGIEAEAGMLGQPVYFQTPEVVGVELTGALPEGSLATDIALRVTELLRQEKVVGKFVEFFGEGAENLSLPDRAVISNMAPEYGATMGYFPVDEKTLEYMKLTGKTQEQIDLIRAYFKEQSIFGISKKGEKIYSKEISLDLSQIKPSCAGPKRPQDRIDIENLKEEVLKLIPQSRKTTPNTSKIKDGSVLIAAITSCTNTSNPSVMLAAGLVAKKACLAGLEVPSFVKTSLSPGSRAVSDYLEKADVQKYLDALGFNLTGYGCMTCIGNSGPLSDEVTKEVENTDILTCSVLSGNRNFEARVHALVKANYLMSPAMVVVFALAGRVDINLDKEPLGISKEGKEVFFKDIWPTNSEIEDLLHSSIAPEMFISKYKSLKDINPLWNNVQSESSSVYNWDENSTYIQNPPFFEEYTNTQSKLDGLQNMRALAIFGDSVTTDHISPAGAILENGPAGKFLNEKGVCKKDFNSFGSRRGNDRIMKRGTFANVRIKNKMVSPKEGGFTLLQPQGEEMTIFDACEVYAKEKTPLIIFAGDDYGMGSSRDWAAKGTYLLGVKAVVAKSFERIHRSNLVGMGVLPLEFVDQTSDSLGLVGDEIFTIKGLSDEKIEPNSIATLEIKSKDGSIKQTDLKVRIDTSIEAKYYENSGILNYVLKQILNDSK